MIAVPAQVPKVALFICIRCPKNGKIKTAKMLKKKIVEIDKAISSSFASKIGEAAAMAEPPQIAVPNPIKVVKTLPIPNKRPTT